MSRNTSFGSFFIEMKKKLPDALTVSETSEVVQVISIHSFFCLTLQTVLNKIAEVDKNADFANHEVSESLREV